MRFGPRRPVLISCLAALLLVAVTAGAWAVTRDSHRAAPLAAALGSVPATTGAVDFTDWTRLDDPLDDLALRDVTTRSILAPLRSEMDEELGWSVRDIGWEAYARTPGSSVTAIGLGDVSADRARRSFAAIGARIDGGVWRLDDDAGVSADFAATFAWVRVVPSRQLLIGAPDRASLEAASAALDGSGPSLLDDQAVLQIARRLEGADSALLENRELLCSGSGVGDVPAGIRLADPTWGARALTDSDPQQMVFAMAFGSDRVAREQAAARAQLTRGAFVGRSGEVRDSLTDPRTSESAGVLSFAFTRAPDGEPLMAATTPVPFAACS